MWKERRGAQRCHVYGCDNPNHSLIGGRKARRRLKTQNNKALLISFVWSWWYLGWAGLMWAGQGRALCDHMPRLWRVLQELNSATVAPPSIKVTQTPVLSSSPDASEVSCFRTCNCINMYIAVPKIVVTHVLLRRDKLYKIQQMPPTLTIPFLNRIDKAWVNSFLVISLLIFYRYYWKKEWG